MRSLTATGWLNFRMRAMVMSFASYNLWLPWRETGLHLARQFTDYEPGIHWPQTQMQSGTTGINTIRIYSVVKQGHDQDPDGLFVRRWVPELADVPDRHLQEPWTWEGAATVIGRRYPERIVDLTASTAAAKDKIYAARRSEGFRAAADAISVKHGSRKGPRAGKGRGQANGPPMLISWISTCDGETNGSETSPALHQGDTADQDLPPVPSAVRLAQKVGARVGRGQVLLRPLSP